MLDAIDASGLKDDTFVMLSADHGGKGGFGGQGGHGGQTVQVQTFSVGSFNKVQCTKYIKCILGLLLHIGHLHRLKCECEGHRE